MLYSACLALPNIPLKQTMVEVSAGLVTYYPSNAFLFMFMLERVATIGL